MPKEARAPVDAETTRALRCEGPSFGGLILLLRCLNGVFEGLEGLKFLYVVVCFCQGIWCFTICEPIESRALCECFIMFPYFATPPSSTMPESLLLS